MAENKTDYVILSSPDSRTWEVQGIVPATDRRSALRTFYEAPAAPAVPDGCTFQAVPVSSWRPLNARARVGVSVGEASAPPAPAQEPEPLALGNGAE